MITPRPTSPTDTDPHSPENRLAHEGQQGADVVAPHEHTVQFYETVPFLLDAVTASILPALRDGDSVLMIAAAGHRDGICQRLAASGVDPLAATERGQLTTLDAEEMLGRIMDGDMPSASRFMSLAGKLIERLSRAGRPVRVYGEMVALLAAKGNHQGALRLEALWNSLLREHAFSLLCSCPIELHGPGALDDMCAAHSRVVPAESYSAQRTEADRLHAVVALQQKARQLEAAMSERLLIEERLIAALASELTARQDAQAVQLLLDAQLADTAHELRNPLTSLSLNAQLLLRQLDRDRELDPERVEVSLQAISNQAARMARLLDRLLDVSAGDAAALALAEEPNSGETRQAFERSRMFA